MGFGQAISSGFRNYVNFSGRTPRSGFWYWTLFVAIVVLVTILLDVRLFDLEEKGIPPITALAYLVLILPTLAVGARRLHDIDFRAWWLLLHLVPIGGIVLIIFACLGGTPGPNRFGPDPLAGDLLTPPRSA